MSETTLYALDFDGVICDSALETGLSAWLAARQIWSDLPEQIPDSVLAGFREVRPVLETGFEAILINRCLFDGITPSALLADFSAQMSAVRQQYQVHDADLKSRFASVRDQWIATDFTNWIHNNPLYPDMAELLQKIPPAQLFIITTKQERFVHAILAAQSLELPDNQVFGMDKQLKKTAILAALQKQFPSKCIFFVEDRLPTLLDVIAIPELKTIHLGFAAWGYNTLADKHAAQQQQRLSYLASPVTLLLS